MNKAGAQLNVLLVEDLEDDRFIFEHTLKKARPSANFFSANDGVEALDFLQKQGRFAAEGPPPQPDCIFLDLKMPGLNGFDVLRWMKDRNLVDKIKVFVLSGSSEPRDMELARELGAHDYIVKPATVEHLREILPA